MVNFGPLAAEIVSLVWGNPGNFNGFRVLAALLHGTLVVGVRQTLRRWTEGTTYIRQGGHHVGHWPTFLVVLRTQSVQYFAHQCPCTTRQLLNCTASYQKNKQVQQATAFKRQLKCGPMSNVRCRMLSTATSCYLMFINDVSDVIIIKLTNGIQAYFKLSYLKN